MVCLSLAASHFLVLLSARSRRELSVSLSLYNSEAFSNPENTLLASPLFGSKIAVVTFRRFSRMLVWDQ